MGAPLALIVAVAENGVIGRDGSLPWAIPGDMAWFKAKTTGKPVIMGRKTWDSLPRKPLPGRPNIVVTRNPGWDAAGAYAVGSLDDAIACARAVAPQADEIMVIGGAALIAEAMPQVSRIYLTEVHASPEGDVHMPPFDRAAFIESSREGRPADGGAPAHSFVILERR